MRHDHCSLVLEAHVHASKATSDPIERLRTVARSYAAVCDSPLAKRIVRLQIAQNNDADDPSHADGFRLRHVVDDWFQPILRRCADAGFLKIDKLVEAYALIIGFIAHQTLTYGLIINESKTAKLSGDKVADEAARVALLAYG
jgi:hypothetical protein